MKPTDICIVGCGKVARLHSTIARTLKKDVRLSYASRSLDRAEEYRKKYKGFKSFGSYEEACQDPDIEAIFLCTPHAGHVDEVRMAASAGKHLLIEKPITRTLDELSQVEAIVDEKGVIAMLAENYHFKPLARELRHHIERGDIGTPMFLELNHVKRSNVQGWRADAEMMGGGALLEGGVHWVNLLCGIGGPVTEVIAAEPRIKYEKVAPFEDALEILCRFENGTVGKMIHSWNTLNRVAGLSWSKLFGTDGNITFESNGIFALVLGKRRRLRFPGFLDIMGYREMLRHFAQCVREGKQPEMSLDLARRDMEIIDAAYRSLESGRFEAPISRVRNS